MYILDYAKLLATNWQVLIIRIYPSFRGDSIRFFVNLHVRLAREQMLMHRSRLVKVMTKVVSEPRFPCEL